MTVMGGLFVHEQPLYIVILRPTLVVRASNKFGRRNLPLAVPHLRDHASFLPTMIATPNTAKSIPLPITKDSDIHPPLPSAMVSQCVASMASVPSMRP